MTLLEIEQAIQARIDYMAKIDESPIECALPRRLARLTHRPDSGKP